MTLMQVELDDKYRLESKRIFLSGMQALVRLPMLQRERDRLRASTPAASSRAIAARRSAMYDHALWRAKSHLQQHDIAFVPGLNEDLGGDRGLGQPAGQPVPRRQGRWRVRHLVRQGARRRSLGRRAQACECRRHLAQWRRARACRRRPRLPVLDAGAPERAGVRGGADPGDQSGDAAGLSSTSASTVLRCRASPAAGSASRRSAKRWRVRPRSTAIRERIQIAPRRFRDAARRPQHPLARSAAGRGECACSARSGAAQAFARANRSTASCSIRPARPRHRRDRQGLPRLRQALDDLGITDKTRRDLGMRVYKVAMTWPLERKRRQALRRRASRTSWWSRRSAASSKTR